MTQGGIAPVFVASLVAISGVAAAAAAESALPSPEEAQQRWLHRLQGRHFTATLLQLIEGRGARRLTVWRDDAEGRERLLLRFEKPHALAGRSWLLLEEPGEEDALYYYSTRDANTPARRIPSLRARDPLEGADPNFLGLRAGTPRPAAESIEEVLLDGQRTLLLSERAANGSAPFERRRVWLDPETWVALRLEHERVGQTVLVGELLKLAEVQGVATPMQVRFERPEGETILYQFETMDYRRPIRASYFELPD